MISVGEMRGSSKRGIIQQGGGGEGGGSNNKC